MAGPRSDAERVLADRSPDVHAGPFNVRHRTAREAVFASQRGRLEEALADAACDKGLTATTVGDVVKRARVSRRTFYEHFKDKDECCLEAYRTAIEFLVARLDAERARVDPEDWRARVRIGLETFVDTVIEEPRFARFVLVESRAGDARVADARAELYDRVVDQYVELNETARTENPEARPVERGVFLLLVAGIADVAAELLRRDELERLRELLESFIELHVAVVSGMTTTTSVPQTNRAMRARRAQGDDAPR